MTTITSLDKRKIRFLLLEGIHPKATEVLNRAGYSNIENLKSALPEAELVERIKDVHFIGIRSRTQLNRAVFEAASRLVGVGCFCIGTNQVDLPSAMARGIPVFNAPYSNTRSVAELVLAQSIMLLRGIPEKNALAHRGIWRKSASNSFEIRGKRLGIVGYGNIGSQLSVMAESLGMQVSFYDVVTKLPLGNATQTGSLEELLETADIVTLHVPETVETRRMIGARQIDRMKPTSILINASRGTVVDIEALSKAMKNNRLLGAALDVFPTEPGSNSEEFISPLRDFDNVILTPHIGGSTMEAQENIGQEVAEKLARYSDTGATLSAVNFPEVSLPAHPDNHRLLHIHHNVPGVISEINTIFSDNNINVCGQYLQTRGDIGYVVVDIDRVYSELALSKLRAVNGTIRCRVLF